MVVGGRRRPGWWLPGHLRREARLELTRLSLPSLNWLVFPDGGRLGAADPRPRWPLEAFLDGAVAAGFTAVGLDHLSLRGLHSDEVARMLRGRGLTCSDLGVLALGRADARRTAYVLAEAATATGARTCVAALAAPFARSDALRALDGCAAVLTDAGVRLALEFTSYGGLTRLADAVRLCEEVGWERCGLLVDSWHFVRTGTDWRALGALAGEQIALVHLSDGKTEGGDDPVRDGRYGRIPPGAGSFPLQTFAAALDSCGYSGFLSLEVLSDTIRLLPPDEGARLLLNEFELTLG